MSHAKPWDTACRIRQLQLARMVATSVTRCGHVNQPPHQEQGEKMGKLTEEAVSHNLRLVMGLGYVVTDDLSIFNSSKGFGLYFHGGEGDANLTRLCDLETEDDLHKCMCLFCPDKLPF